MNTVTAAAHPVTAAAHPVTADQRLQAQRSLARDAFTWMFLGLGLTGVVAWLVASAPALVDSAASGGIFLASIGVELGLVVWLSARAERLSAATARTAFLVFSGVSGLTFSFVFVVFAGETIGKSFLLTATLFGALAAIGWTTSADLTRIGTIAFAGLIALVATSIINLLVGSAAVEWITTIAGIPVFMGLTAHDTQKLKEMGAGADESNSAQLAILAALTLYLDFVNLFLRVLELLGRAEDG